MNRRNFLRGLFGSVAVLLGLGASGRTAKAADNTVREPLRIVEKYANWETREVNSAGLTEKRLGGFVRLNRLPEPGEQIPVYFLHSFKFRMVEFQWHVSIWKPEASWSMRCVEIEKHDSGAMTVNQTRGQV